MHVINFLLGLGLDFLVIVYIYNLFPFSFFSFFKYKKKKRQAEPFNSPFMSLESYQRTGLHTAKTSLLHLHTFSNVFCIRGAPALQTLLLLCYSLLNDQVKRDLTIFSLGNREGNEKKVQKKPKGENKRNRHIRSFVPPLPKDSEISKDHPAVYRRCASRST